MTSMNQTYCNNCGKYGHSFNHCKVPITSFGIIAFRKTPSNEIEYLMIKRKDTLGYVDFMRGKYSVYNKDYVMNMIKQMTYQEKEGLLKYSFDYLWGKLWGETAYSEQYMNEKNISQDKYYSLLQGLTISGKYYSLKEMIAESNCENIWLEAEWGFPKGRRNYQEKDFNCAVREFCEETGYKKTDLVPIQNILPYEEIFMGSNYKSYKHKYYLNYIPYSNTLSNYSIQHSEIGEASWNNYETCITKIRHYNLEKMRVLTQIHNVLQNYLVYTNISRPSTLNNPSELEDSEFTEIHQTEL